MDGISKPLAQIGTMSTYCRRGLMSKREAQEQEIVPLIDITAGILCTTLRYRNHTNSAAYLSKIYDT